MLQYSIFPDPDDRQVVVSGGGAAAVDRLRQLIKTRVRLTVFSDNASSQIQAWAEEGRLNLAYRPFDKGDALGIALFCAANGDDAEDARVVDLARAEGAQVSTTGELDAFDLFHEPGTRAKPEEAAP